MIHTEFLNIDNRKSRYLFANLKAMKKAGDVGVKIVGDIIYITDHTFDDRLLVDGSVFRQCMLHTWEQEFTIKPVPRGTLMIGIISPRTGKKILFMNGKYKFPFNQQLYGEVFVGYTFPDFVVTNYKLIICE